MPTWLAGNRGFSAGNVASIDTGSISFSGTNKYGNAFAFSGAGSPASASSVVLDPAGVNQSFTPREAAVVFNTVFDARPWYLLAPSDVSAKIVRATWPANQDETMILVDFYSGVDQTTGHRTPPTPAQGIGANPTLNVTSVAGDTVIGQVAWGIKSPSLTTVTSSQITVRQKIEGADIGQYEACCQGDVDATGTTTTVGASNPGGGSANYVVFGAALIPSSGGGDTTAPVLSSPTGSSAGSTTATGTVSTDEANGTLYVVVTTSSTAPTSTQVFNGQNHLGAAAAWAGNQAISTTGTKTANATGLSASTTYWFHYMHRDAAGNSSTVVSSASFTTSAAPQYARPNAGVTDGAWTPNSGADNYATLDETSASDADYDTSNSNSTVRVGLSSVSTPAAGTQTMRVRAQGSPNKKLIARLVEGASTVRGTITVDPLTSTMTTYTATPSGISNYGDLDLEIEVADATTPVTPTVTFGAAGTAGTTTNTTSHTVNLPAGIQAGDTLYLFATGMSSTAGTDFAITGGGWTNVGTLESGSGAAFGIDTGNRRVTVFKRNTLGSAGESGTVTLTLAGSATNTIFGTIINVRGPANHTITESFSSGADTSAGTGFSATGGTSLSWQAGDLLAILVASSTDTATQSAQSITATGVTFGTRTNQRSTACTGGNDHRHILDTVPVSSGSGSSAPTYAYTASASTSGPVVFLRIRAVPPTEFARVSWAEVEFPAAASAPAISGVSSANPQYLSSFTITGTAFNASQGTRLVKIGGATCSVTSWSDTSITVTVARGTNKYGVALNVEIYDGASLISNSFGITSLQPQTGWSYVNVATPNTTAANRLTTTPDASSGDQVAWGNIVGTGSVNVFNDLTFNWDTGLTSFDFELWTTTDGYGATATQNLVAVLVTATMSLGAAIQLSRSLTTSVQVAVQATQQVSANIDAAILAGRTATANVQVAIQQALTSITNLGAAIQASGTPVSTSLSVALQQARSITMAVDIAIQQGNTRTVSIDTAVQAARTVVTQLDAVVQQAKSLPADLSAAIQDTRSVAAGINAQIQAGFTVSTAVDLAISAARSVGTQIDTVLSLARQAQASLQTAVLATTTAQVGIDVQVEAAAEKNTQISAAILQQNKTLAAVMDTAVQIGRSGNMQIGTAVQQALAVAASIQAALQAGKTAAAGIDAYVQSQGSKTVSIDAVLQQSNSIGTGLTTAILASTTSIVSLSAYVQAAFEVSAQINAAVRDTHLATAQVDAVLQLARSAATSISVAAQVARLAAVSIDAQVQAGSSASTSVGAAIREAMLAVAGINAAVSTAQQTNTKLDTSVAETFTAFVDFDLLLMAVNTRIVGVGVYIEDPAASPDEERDVIATPETRDYEITPEIRDVIIPATMN